jgi:probable metal-binding protein
MESIHGHDLMHWIEQGPPRNRAEIERDAQIHFGANAQFHTCSLEDLSLQALLDFLYSRGKIRDEGKGTQLVGEHICSDH